MVQRERSDTSAMVDGVGVPVSGPIPFRVQEAAGCEPLGGTGHRFRSRRPPAAAGDAYSSWVRRTERFFALASPVRERQ